MEIGGESSSPALIPYNVNSQSIRQRFWDGQDKSIKDDLTIAEGQSPVRFRRQLSRNFDYHSRTDNGSAVNDQISYLSTSSGFNWTSPIKYIPTSVPSTSYSSWETLYAEVTRHDQLHPGDVYARAANLSPLPIGTPATDKSIIPSYTTYFNDTWHMKPTFTLTYGFGWNLEMPPYELQGKQVELVDSNNQPIDTTDFIAQRRRRRCKAGRTLPRSAIPSSETWATDRSIPIIRTTANSARAHRLRGIRATATAFWAKMFGSGKTVIRGGYGRIFGRLNGVDLVLVPLLGPGLLQGVTCVNPLSNGTCAGSGVATPANAFRIGPDGLAAPLAAPSSSLPQPFFPGVGNESGKRGCQHSGPDTSNRTVPINSRSPCSARSIRTCSLKWAISARS